MAGQGFALLTPLLWKGDVAAGRLSMPFPDRVSTRGWAYWLVYPHGAQDGAEGQALPGVAAGGDGEGARQAGGRGRMRGAGQAACLTCPRPRQQGSGARRRDEIISS